MCQFRILLIFFLVPFCLIPVFAQESPEPAASNTPTPESSSLESEIATIPWTTNDQYEPVGDPRAVKGGTMRWPIWEYPSTLRSFGPNSSTTFNSLMNALCYESLLSYHPVSLEWVPGLADKWYKTPDNRTFYFHIDPEARFMDGKPVTATDVYETWKFLIDPAISSPSENTIYSLYQATVLSDRIIRFTAQESKWRLFNYLCGMMIFPGDVVKTAAKTYIQDYQFTFMPGSGPYRFKDTIKGREITFERRPDYWAAHKRHNIGLYNFDVFRCIVVRDDSLMFEMLKKGDIDFYAVYTARRWMKECDFDKIQKGWIQKRKIFSERPAGISGVAFNMREEPFNDVRVRAAFQYLFNRDILIQKLFFNEYVPLNSYYPGGIYANENNPEFHYSADEAVRLLSEAGWNAWDKKGRICKNGVPLEITLMYEDKSSERIWTVVQDYMADVGVTLKLKLVTAETQWKLIEDRKFKIAEMAWSGDLFPDPRQSYHSSMAYNKNTANITGVADPQIDRLIEEHDQCDDLQRRIELIKQIDGLLVALHPYGLSWYESSDRLLYWNKFGHPDYYITRVSDYSDMAIYWWIDPEKESALNAAIAENRSLPQGPVDVNFWKDYKDHPKPLHADHSNAEMTGGGDR